MECCNIKGLKKCTTVKYVIAVDGGGTKTVGVLADETGAELANGEVGASNAHAMPQEEPVVGAKIHILENLQDEHSVRPGR